MRHITTEERRARLAARHHLVRPAPAVTQVAGDLVGLHSSDPATPYLSAWARVESFSVGDLETALFEDRSLVRMLGMRRTMFVVPRDLAAVMDSACTKALAPAERRRIIRLLEDQGIATDGATWVTRVEEATLQALGSRGEATAVELTGDVPELGEKLSFGEGKKWAGTVGVSTRILYLLATEARIVRARPLGTWLSSQYRWAGIESWLGEKLAGSDPTEARAALTRRWLGSFGPGTLNDIKWWTGWTVTQTRAALAAVGAVEVDLDGKVGYLGPDDLAPFSAAEPWVALLPGLDPTVMGWKERSWYLADHQPMLFDRNGNAGPTVWLNGRIVGGWGQRETGEIVTRLLQDVGSDAVGRIDSEAKRFEEWLGDARMRPRFRTPLDKELSGY